ncbi:phage tail protein [Pseudoalteromonas sp. NBT06-2]|uniref:phage tail protein n=1 Tax=Pseudoalteromonas sp. NBT06-2 TaxID=2025950 RepID=UPI000BA6F5D8|nr:phage tail protein [Pseudoalteromonas sp. NBT06-2]PAJ72050.1 phage tail protein [Pseudoalteromonas sp. NBT06-2]
MSIEQSLTQLQQANAELHQGVNSLTHEVTSKMGEINSKLAAKESQVDAFLADAQPETRYEQDIFIGGSKDYLYPVWWRFPNNSSGVSNLTVCRTYSWNGGVSERPLNTGSAHQAALLLELEGNDSPWGGDAHILNIKRFHEGYNSTVSHVAYQMYCKAEKVDPDKPLYSGANLNFSSQERTRSGLYLRGGGLTYRIIKNWIGDVSFHDGSDQLRRNISTTNLEPWSVRWYAEPIPFTDRDAPITSTIPYINHPYTPPSA